ncbi:RpiB/LacA/LacB family sugar-phosphate isomerase [Tetragenococcus halophilus]|uniref:RpiB/LacA/LacB family sugar-phosphate isomerase n=1 Tax=Tetragenococcus halophilus TaxID=51669 RepID=UPI0021BAA2C8|nr:RpiB/LacA/LacB family sugar-phosphate isomerase [Tetragenococcus halophilus]MCT8311235.1 RpiB/LacA/LacB family sugar-phosphate isomerase [Tetragenococcus halophilus]
MKIALLNEFSQAAKNPIILKELQEVAQEQGHEVYNVGMEKPAMAEDVPEAYTENNPRLTYIHIGIQAALLLNSGAADFVVAGCGTGQGALMSLNSFPGVFCGYCIEPTDAYLFLQINNGNALSIPFAKGFGWGAELNIRNIFEKAFSSPAGMGYPKQNKASQVRNAAILSDVKKATNRPLLEGLKKIDKELFRVVLTPRFLDCFYKGCQDNNIKEFVDKETK